MNVCLISKDEEIDGMFRRISARLTEVTCTVIECAAERGTADLYIWDLEGLSQIPTLIELGDETRHTFLLAAEDLVPLHRRLTGSAIRVLLKPVQEPVLSRFLEEALSRWRSRSESPGDSRRAERDDLLQCLLHAGAGLQRRATDRANFITRALQDLWAPLTAADGYCAILLHQSAGNLSRDQAEAVRQLQRSVHRARTAANVLAQLGLDSVHAQPLLLISSDILECIERAVAAAAPSANAKDISVVKQLDAPSGRIYFDLNQMEQVLVNLLENAFRFTPRSGSITLRAYPVAWGVRDFRLRSADDRWFVPARFEDGTDAYRMDVSDSGPPVPVESANSVFDQYSPYCGKNDRSGLGLGLAASRLTMLAHGGAAFVESRPSGATFSVVLPFVRPDDATMPKGNEPGGMGVLRG